MKQKGQLTILVLVGILILVGVAGGAYFLEKQTLSLRGSEGSAAILPTSSPTPSITESTPSADMKDWKTYTNIKYKYSLLVPQDYLIGECEDNSIIRISSTKQGIECQQGASGLLLWVFDKSIASKHLESIHNDYSVKEKTLMVNGFEGIQLEGKLKINSAPIPSHIVSSVFEGSNKTYLFEYQDYSNGSENTLYSQILSTFRFLP